MDAFFAAIEEQRHPEYRGKPLVVGGRGDPHERGVVSTANYEARKFGIHSAMPLRLAYRKCPQCIFLPVDFEKYIEVSRQFKAILGDYTPLIEFWGLDEAYLDMSDVPRSAIEIAMEIKKRIKKDLGLTCSVGVAPNKLLAKMASSLNKPNGLTVLKSKGIAMVVAPMPVSALLWVGPRTTARLKEMRISTIGELQKVPLNKLVETFGPAAGQMLYNSSRGIDESPVVPFHEAKSIGHETTFQVDTKDIKVVKGILSEFAKYLAEDMKKSDFWGRTVTVKIRYKDFLTHTHAHTLPKETNSQRSIYQAALEALKKFEFDREVRLVGLRVSNLKKD
jgi:DNA polymerase-4